jgi:uncharacterized protein
MRRTALIIFQKNEVRGKVKTRLAATVGDEAALKIYKILINYTHQVIQSLPVDTYIFFSDFIPDDTSAIPIDFSFKIQSRGDLGERMKNAFQMLFNLGYQKILILGTDCADLQTIHIESALEKLNKVDVVIGPAEDGGYYLLGMKKFSNTLFEEIEWSTINVFNQTVAKLNQANLTYDTTTILSDIDREEDWEKVKLKFN